MRRETSPDVASLHPGHASSSSPERERQENTATLRAAKNRPRRIFPESHAKRLGQTTAALGRELQRAGVAHAREPAAFEAAAADLGADMACDVIAPFAPVEARPAIDAAVLGVRREHGAEQR